MCRDDESMLQVMSMHQFPFDSPYEKFHFEFVKKSLKRIFSKIEGDVRYIR